MSEFTGHDNYLQNTFEGRLAISFGTLKSMVVDLLDDSRPDREHTKNMIIDFLNDEYKEIMAESAERARKSINDFGKNN